MLWFELGWDSCASYFFKKAICSSRKASCSSRKATIALMLLARNTTHCFIDSFIAFLCTNRQQPCWLAVIKSTFSWVRESLKKNHLKEKFRAKKKIRNKKKINSREKKFHEKNFRENQKKIHVSKIFTRKNLARKKNYFFNKINFARKIFARKNSRNPESSCKIGRGYLTPSLGVGSVT